MVRRNGLLLLCAALLGGVCAPARGATVSLQPAAGAVGTLATVRGAGLPARRGVAVRVGAEAVQTVTDARGAFSVRVRVRARAVRTAVGRARIVNHFAIGGRRSSAEVATPAGAWLRWSPLVAKAGAPIRLTGGGVRAQVPVAVWLEGRPVAKVRASRTGRFAATVAANGRRGEVRAGRVRLPFAIGLIGGTVTGDAAEPAPGGDAAAPAAAQPGAVAPTRAGEPSLPLRGAFYYPWFPEAWDQHGMRPYTHFHPSAGLYDSSDQSLIFRHLDELAYAHVDVGISSWWGQGHRTDRRLPQLLAATRAAGSPLRWAVYYEPEGPGDPTVGQIASDLAYLRDHYASDPAYLRLGGRFVVFVYGGGSDSCATADRWRSANAGIGAYVVLKVVSGYRSCAAQPDGWHQYAPSSREDSQRGQSFSISPGFWLASDPAPRLARDPAAFAQAVRDMVASRAPWQLVTTFNEWGEGTSVEPADEWATGSGYGAYLDALHGA